jgi:glycosyltransferase involved in cell wall biosynthesis
MALPVVTVIMPIRNEEGFIARSLGAIVAQDYPADLLHILVVDGMSDDATRSVVQQMIDANTAQNAAARPTIRLLDNPARIVPTAFNIGLQHAEGDVIVRVDGHCEIAPDYVRRCVEALDQTGADNVGGLMRAVGQGAEAEAIALATSSPFGVGGARFHYATEAGWVDTVYLGAYRREVFERIGGFDEELVRNQDDEFNFRLTQAGGKIWLDPAIKSLYYSRASLLRLWRQYYQYGFYKVRVMQKRGGVASWRHLVPGAFVLSLVGSLALALLLRKPLLGLGVLGPYALANAAASLKTAQGNRVLLRWLPLVFFTLHTAYGIGFLAGLWHWTRAPQADALKAQHSV